MKKLVESLVNAVLEADEKVIGIYGGGFKPPTQGHYEVIENIIKTNPQLDKLYIAVGQKERDGITQADSLLVFGVYKKYFPFKVEIVPTKSVYNYIKDFVEENPDKKVIAFRGAREDKQEDTVDNKTFKLFLDRYTPEVEFQVIKTLSTVSGTKARQALQSGKKEKFFEYLPSTLSNLDKQKIYDILTATIEENSKKAAINAYSRELALGLEEQQGKIGYRAGSINPKTPQERLKDRGFALTRSTTGLLGTGFYFYGDKDQAVTSAKQDGRKNYTEIDLSQYKLFRPSSPEKFYQVIKNLTLLLTDLIFDEKVDFEDEKVQKQLDLYSSYLSKELDLTDLEIELAAQSFIDDVAQSKDGVLLSNRILSDYDGIDLTGTSLDNFAVGSLIFDGKLKPGSYTSTKIQDLEEEISPADPKTVDPRELKMGIEVEMEHTKDPNKAKIIALQHLAEDPKYYTKLSSLGLEERTSTINFKALEKQLDDMFAELDIDVNFSYHFKERVIQRGLTEEDILELATKIINQYPDKLDSLEKNQNIVMSHLSRLVDIAAVNTGYGEDYLKDLVFKTAFKRKDKSEPEFRTNKTSPRLVVKENHQSRIFKDLLVSLGEFLKQQLNLKSLPNLEYIKDDSENAENILGNTAYYNPNSSTIVLYTQGRHPKDILRSYAHEMIHYHQHQNGKLSNKITTTNINQDDYLKQIEEEAYLNGNILFRSWENSLKK